MYDIDAGRSPSLRLDAPSRADLQAKRAKIRRQIDALWVEYCDLVLESDTQEAQSQPIPVSEAHSAPSALPPHVAVHVHRAGRALGDIARQFTGALAVQSARVAQASCDNDFWTHRHRTMTGPDPLVTRSNGYVERLHPLAARELLHEDDGA